jgi:hypothetical protein
VEEPEAVHGHHCYHHTCAEETLASIRMDWTEGIEPVVAISETLEPQVAWRRDGDGSGSLVPPQTTLFEEQNVGRLPRRGVGGADERAPLPLWLVARGLLPQPRRSAPRQRPTAAMARGPDTNGRPTPTTRENSSPLCFPSINGALASCCTGDDTSMCDHTSIKGCLVLCVCVCNLCPSLHQQSQHHPPIGCIAYTRSTNQAGRLNF